MIRFVSGLVLCGLLLFAPPALAQGTHENPAPPVGADRTDFGACLGRYPPATGSPRDTDRPAGLGAFDSPRNSIRNAQLCAAAYAADFLLPTYGTPLYRALALIVIVWTGVTFMFNRSFDMGELISLIFLIGFVSLLLQSYSLSFDVFGAESFPGFVSSLGIAVSNLFVPNVWADVVGAWNSALNVWQSESVNQEAIRNACGPHPVGGTLAVSPEVIAQRAELCAVKQAQDSFLLVFIIFFVLAVVLGAIPLLVAFFSYLWGYFSLVVITLMGPLLIPFGLLPQTSFLMWGWIRSIVAATVQMMIGGAVFLITATLLLTPLRRYTMALRDILGDSGALSAGEAFGRGAAMALEFLPIAVIAMLGAFKASELTAMIMSGGAPPASGLGQRARDFGSARSAAGSVAGGVAGAARGAAAGVAAVASGGAGAAARVLSAATKAR